MAPSHEEPGLRNEALRSALDEALAGQSDRLEDLLCRHGGMPCPRPKLKLAAAFGAEMGIRTGAVVPLLQRLGGDDAAPDTARVYLAIAAAHGWAGRVRAGRDRAEAWAGLADLAADEREPVRIGALDALISLATRSGGADELVVEATAWLDGPHRELRFSAAGTVIEALADSRILSSITDREAVLTYLAWAVAEVAAAPRAAERSEGRRRMLQAFPRTLAAVVTSFDDDDQGSRWMAGLCEQADHPDVRESLSQSLAQLRGGSRSVTVAALRKVLEASAKPLRDPTRRRPGTGRGKSSRRIR